MRGMLGQLLSCWVSPPLGSALSVSERFQEHGTEASVLLLATLSAQLAGSVPFSSGGLQKYS
jgi:hypothetical protein